MHVRRRELKRAHPTSIARTVLMPCLNEVVQRCAVQSTEKVGARYIRDTKVHLGTSETQWVHMRQYKGHSARDAHDAVLRAWGLRQVGCGEIVGGNDRGHETGRSDSPRPTVLLLPIAPKYLTPRMIKLMRHRPSIESGLH